MFEKFQDTKNLQFQRIQKKKPRTKLVPFSNVQKMFKPTRVPLNEFLYESTTL